MGEAETETEAIAARARTADLNILVIWFGLVGVIEVELWVGGFISFSFLVVLYDNPAHIKLRLTVGNRE
jgi:hypothetical protein